MTARISEELSSDVTSVLKEQTLFAHLWKTSDDLITVVVINEF